MDNSQRYENLFKGLEDEKKRIGEGAARFPTKEEYLDKDTEERLDAAKEILEKYAHTSRQYWEGKSAAARITPSDRPEMSLVTNVRHLSERTERERINEGRRSGNYITKYTVPEAINVRVWAQDVENDMTSDMLALGELREGRYVDDEGEDQDGWHVFIPDGQHGPNGKTAILSSRRGQEMIEFVDAAVVGLIEGKISAERKFLGDQALEGAAQA